MGDKLKYLFKLFNSQVVDFNVFIYSFEGDRKLLNFYYGNR